MGLLPGFRSNAEQSMLTGPLTDAAALRRRMAQEQTQSPPDGPKAAQHHKKGPKKQYSGKEHQHQHQQQEQEQKHAERNQEDDSEEEEEEVQYIIVDFPDSAPPLDSLKEQIVLKNLASS